MSARSHGASIGRIAAATTFATSLAYVVGQLFEWAGLLGSQGGPGAASTPAGITVLLLPSLLLGPAYVITLAALQETAPETAKVAARSALALAIAYAVLTGFVYIIQLTFVGPRLASGQLEGIELLQFLPYKSFLFAVDLWGYSLMCLSALFASFAVPRIPAFGKAALFLRFTGLLTPALALQMQFPQLIWIGALWGITFPTAAWLLWRGFGRIEAA